MDEATTRRRGLLLAPALAGALAPGAAAAQEGYYGRAAADRRSAAASVARANAGTVGVITGGVDGTYVRVAADLAAVLDDGDRLRVLPILGKGSVQNLSDIARLRGVDLGVVQSDALAYVRRERLLPGADGLIRSVAKLYDEEVHVLARADVARVEDLAGREVNVDVRGSGTAMTASLIFEGLGLKVQALNMPQDEALLRLRRGEIGAMVYVAGRPARLFSGVEAGSGLRFLSLPADPALLETYLPAEIRHADYPNLVPEDDAVETLAVGAVLAAYAWQPGTDRFSRVARFADDLRSKFPALLRPPRHPKWREVNLAAQAPGWTRFDAAARPGAGRR